MWEAGLTTSTSVVGLAFLHGSKAPIAHLTGTEAYIPSDSEILAIRRYVDGGGVLLIDACGGSKAFANSIETAWLPQLFPDASLQAIAPDHPMLRQTLEGMEDATTLRLRPSTFLKVAPKDRSLKILSHGKGMIVYSQLDLTTGLAGSNTMAGLGYDAMYAEDLVKDVVLWAYGRGSLSDAR